MGFDGHGRHVFGILVNSFDHPLGEFDTLVVAVVVILLGRVEFEGAVSVGGMKCFFGQLDGFHGKKIPTGRS